MDVIVIGAGLSGLVTAHRILKKEPTLSVAILEADNRIGGQINGELGAQWFLPDQYHLIDLCDELNVHWHVDVSAAASPRPWESDKTIVNRIALFELNRFIAEIDLVCRKKQSSSESTDDARGGGTTRQHLLTFTCSNANDGSMEQYLCGKLVCNRSRNVIRFCIRASCGVDATDISVGDYLMYCRQTNGISGQLRQVTGVGDHILKLATPCDQLCNALGQHIATAGGVILLNCRVERVVCRSRRIVDVYANTGDRFVCSILVVAVPWQVAQQFDWKPRLPSLLPVALPQSDCRRMMSRFVVRYGRAFWRDKGHSGSFLVHSPFAVCCRQVSPATLSGVVLHTARDFDDDKEEDDDDAIATAVAAGETTPELQTLNSKLRAFVLHVLADNVGADSLWPVEFLAHTWEQSMHHRRPQSMVNIVWAASTDAGSLYRGFLNGAVQGGMRAALLSLDALRPQSIDWQDIAAAQRASVVRERRVGMWESFWCSINVHTVIYYSSFAILNLISYSLFKKLSLINHTAM